jgi:CubicO group peptidase (beta-lactamase class C family)
VRQPPVAISGHVKPGFEAVRDAFAENFARRNELGANCCLYYRGEKVVDLWGGIRNKLTGEPWEEDTMTCVYSTTKGMAGLALALAHSRGLFSYDERIATYWPEFGQHGKDRITVRHLLAHQAGLFAFDQTRGQEPHRGSRPAGGRLGPAEAGMGARNAAGLPCRDPRLL